VSYDDTGGVISLGVPGGSGAPGTALYPYGYGWS